jgi:hypothetical protein
METNRMNNKGKLINIKKLKSRSLTKIMFFVIILLLLVVIWMNQWKYQLVGQGYLRVNRITGKVYVWTIEGIWVPYQKQKEDANKKEDQKNNIKKENTKNNIEYDEKWEKEAIEEFLKMSDEEKDRLIKKTLKEMGLLNEDESLNMEALKNLEKEHNSKLKK